MDAGRQNSGNAQAESGSRNAGSASKADPRSRRDRILRALPKYSGPYDVGIVDIEVPVEHPRVFSHITRKKRHLLQLETVLFSVYYPAARGTGIGAPPSGHNRWKKATWLPQPKSDVAKGYGIFAGTPAWFSVAWFLTSTWFTKLPAFRYVGLADHRPADIKIAEGQDDQDPSSPPVFPLIVFTHGLGGTRLSSSTLCGEFASYGFIVTAMEHRDGSGARTFVSHPPEGPGSRAATEGVIDHSQDDLRRPCDQIDYIFPQGNPYDTSPNNEVGVDIELRKAQIELRKAEIKEALRVLQTICDGNGHLAEAQNLRRRNSKPTTTHSTDSIDWSSWKGRFHTSQATICGHSFGAATTIEILRDLTSFPNFSQGIALDMWAAVVHPADRGDSIRRPLLAISSEAFMWWADNYATAKAIAENAAAAGSSNLSWLLTIRGSIHLSQTDIPVLYPRVCSTLLKSSIDPKRAITLNVSLALEFLSLVMMPDRVPASARASAAAAADEGGGLLRKPVTRDMPEEHRPDNKWIGMRLRIPHEFATRVKNRKERGSGRKFPAEEEVWMHVAPSEEDVEAFRRRKT